MTASFDMSRLVDYPDLRRLLEQLLQVWPEHADYCASRFRDDPPGFMRRSDELAKLVLRLAEGDIRDYCIDYRWMCEEFLKEEIFFRRHGRYRLSTFSEAYAEVYNKPEYMSRYVHGILISQLIWTPHARAFDYFRTDFLPRNPAGTSHLEVGPGHGLFLFFAADDSKTTRLEAWDVSQSSIAATEWALKRLQVRQPVALVEQDVLKAPPRHAEFDSAIISEVLEHLERPDLALDTLRQALKPGARLFINAPVNSPAPDHIYLWQTTDEFVAFVKSRGFEIEARQFLPMTGYSLERAVRHKLSISCVVIARRPAHD
jgi:2-polyprenyl-3-methyl-5-hydroxy-6-metoxy-1,4-benzoquinol methylase